MRKGQVSLFILMGIVLLITATVLITLKSNIVEPDENIATNFEVQKVQLSAQIQDCIRTQAREAVEIYGINNLDSVDNVKAYVESNLDNCIDFEVFKKQGLNIEKENPRIDIDASGNYLILNLDYPMVLSSRMSRSELDKFVYNMEVKKGRFVENFNGYTTEIAVIELDSGLRIEIPKGTLIILKNHEENVVMSAETTGKDIIQMYFDFNVANKIFRLGPEGAIFTTPIKLSIRYDPNLLPEGVTEDDLTIVYYDEEQNRWVAVETSINKNNKVATAEIYHFSLYSLAWMMEQFEQDPGAFFGDSYEEGFCTRLKKDLESSARGLALVLYYDDCANRNSDGFAVCNSEKGKKVFSTATAAIISAQAKKSTNAAIRFVSKNIGDYVVESAVGQRLFFDVLRRQPLFGSGWCTENNIPLGMPCLSQIESCIKGDFSCRGITSINDIFSKCSEKAKLYQTEDNSSETRYLDFGYAECAEDLPSGVGCLGIRCTEGDPRYILEMCYEFDTYNPENQICPEGTKLTIGNCPQDNYIRCCVREPVLEYYGIR
jgi:hypothetical protein